MTRRLSIVLLLVAQGCARGDTDPGLARDNCRLRDCGVAVGGQEVEPEDEGVGEEDTSFDSGAAPVDTATDTGTLVVDTGVDSTTCTPPAGAVCGTFPQCGCATGTNCDVTDYATGKTSCVEAGSAAVHQRCSALGHCARGLTCVYGVCMPFCAASSDCGAASISCRAVQYVEGGATKDVPGMRVCMASCDPMNPSKACGASTTCLFSSPSTTTCAGAGTSTTAGSCAPPGSPFTCAPGYVCVGSGDCKRWCRIGFVGDCPGGKACGKLSTAPTIGGIEYGVCAY